MTDSLNSEPVVSLPAVTVTRPPWKALLRRSGRILAAYLITLVGGFVCAGIVVCYSGWMTAYTTPYDSRHVFVIGGIYGLITAFNVGLVICIPISFCRFPRYIAYAASGSVAPGILMATIVHDEGLMFTWLISILGYFSACVAVLYIDCWPRALCPK